MITIILEKNILYLCNRFYQTNRKKIVIVKIFIIESINFIKLILKNSISSIKHNVSNLYIKKNEKKNHLLQIKKLMFQII